MQIHVENTTLRYTTLIALHNTNYTTLVTVHYIKYIRTTTTTTNTATPATTTTLHCSTLHYTNCTTLQLQLIPQIQLHTHTLIRLLYNYESITLRYNYNCATPQHSTSSSCGRGDRCNHCSHFKKHNSNYLSVHQWICSAIRDSQLLLVYSVQISAAQ